MIAAVVTGNLGRDAELRDAGGTPVLSFSVASTRKSKGESVTTWVRCSLFGARGVSLAAYLLRGVKVACSGQLSTREHDGRTHIELRVDDVDLMGGGGGAGRQPAPGRAESDSSGTGDDEIPF